MENTPKDEDKALAEIRALQEGLGRLKAEIGRRIVGQEAVVRELMLALLCRGHALLIGVPGLAKTLMVRTIAGALDLSFNRIQFTPDLMPSDITGTEIIEEDRATGARAFRFVQGPLFSHIVLADEINRTPPKTQAALLEAMQERQVTAGGRKYGLPDPFFVLATQNPIEHEGTYPLPEAQLDRFMFNIRVGYPSQAEEMAIVKATTAGELPEVRPVMAGPEIRALQQVVCEVPVADHVVAYALRLTRSSRPGGDNPDVFIRENVAWGAGPRASQYLVAGGKAHAVLSGASHAGVDDIRAVASAVLRHRLIPSFNAEAAGVGADDIVAHLLKTVPAQD
ncbi:MAG: MoxR family ATPase [Planctomycetota bacterium]